MSRLTIDITSDQHQALKALAALEGKTLKQYALERLLPPVADDASAWADLKRLIAERIEAARTSTTPVETFDAIVAQELRERSKR